ncbi:MAG: hypothetical protein WC545_03235 [Patescibacteria group bacterium]
MAKKRKNKKIYLIAGGLALVAILLLMLFIFRPFSDSKINRPQKGFKGLVIEDNLVLPDTSQISVNDGEFISPGEYGVKLRPQSEQEEVFIPRAVLTLKQAYQLSEAAAREWSPDAALIFIKSLGALGLDGKASAWQLVFGSAGKKQGYEIIISVDEIISREEIETSEPGFALPENWYDSGEAINSLRNLVQFDRDFLSAISFYYSPAAKLWAYGLSTTREGEPAPRTTAMWVR